MRIKMSFKCSLSWCIALLFQLIAFGFVTDVVAEEPKIDWIPGPKTVTIGDDIAEATISKDYIFAGPKDSRRLMEYFGNIPTDREAGLIAPKSGKESWFLIFEYALSGYIQDTDKDKLDADGILGSIKKGTEEANKILKEKGRSTLEILGWQERPHYDEITHNLVWAILAKNDRGEQLVNYNTRLLGRHGYMSVVLVGSPNELAAIKPKVEEILSTFAYKKGKSYAEYVKGDKVAAIGLTALVAGGAGAAAAKFGLFKFLAKGGKAIVLALLAGVAALGKGIRRMFGRGDQA